MFGHISMKEQLIEERRKSAALQAQLMKVNSNLEYLAMMSDVEMEQDEEGGTEDGEEE